ncbi:MAG: hypothetical protein WC310_00145 [Patescibacteria group bacterium]
MAQPMTSEQERQIKRFFEDALIGLGLTKDQAQTLITSGGEFQQEVKDLMLAFVTGKQVYKLARAILGNDFITPEEVAKTRGITYTEEQLRQFSNTLPKVEVLQWLREHGYMLVPGPANPIALLDIRVMNATYFYSKEGGWYANDSEKFSRDDKAAVKWLAVRKDIVPDSTSKTWEEQTVLLSSDEYVPNAGEFAWAITTYYAVRGIYLFPGLYARTSSVGSDGGRVDLGDFGSSGLRVDYYFDDNRSGDLGVASARKL